MAEKNTQLLREENLKKIEEHLDQIVHLATMCHLTREELLSMVEFGMEEYQ